MSTSQTANPSDLSPYDPQRVVNAPFPERELGATFRPLDETLRDVVAWYREHPRSV